MHTSHDALWSFKLVNFRWELHFLAGEIIKHFTTRSLLGALFGFVMAKLTVPWLKSVGLLSNALTEITTTLVSTYITFYIG